MVELIEEAEIEQSALADEKAEHQATIVGKEAHGLAKAGDGDGFDLVDRRVVGAQTL